MNLSNMGAVYCGRKTILVSLTCRLHGIHLYAPSHSSVTESTIRIKTGLLQKSRHRSLQHSDVHMVSKWGEGALELQC